MDITHSFAGLAVSDFAVANQWYEQLFGRQADMLPKEGEAVWHLTPQSSVYIVADPERAGRGLLTIALATGMRTRTVTDPDGNTIKFFEDPARR